MAKPTTYRSYYSSKNVKRSTGRPSRRPTKRYRTKRAPSRKYSSKRAIEKLVRSAISSGAHRERRKMTLEVHFGDNNAYVLGNSVSNTCCRVGITQCIPPMMSAGQGADVRRRTSNKIVITGVCLRMVLSVLDQCKLMVICYEPHETLKRKFAKSLAPLTYDRDMDDGIPHSVTTRFASPTEMGLNTEHSPLMVRRIGSELVIDSPDQQPYYARHATHAGKPLGVFKANWGGDQLTRTFGWNGAGEGAAGWVQPKEEEATAYFKLDKPYEYTYEGDGTPDFARDLELCICFDCPSNIRNLIGAKQNVMGATFKSCVLDVYFHDA